MTEQFGMSSIEKGARRTFYAKALTMAHMRVLRASTADVDTYGLGRSRVRILGSASELEGKLNGYVAFLDHMWEHGHKTFQVQNPYLYWQSRHAAQELAMAFRELRTKGVMQVSWTREGEKICMSYSIKMSDVVYSKRDETGNVTLVFEDETKNETENKEKSV